MSEQGWREFVQAEDLHDWVVLHGGPTAVYRVPSLASGAQLAEAIAGVPGLGPRTTIALTASALTVRLTRAVFGIEPDHVEVARAISAVARAHGVTADRAATQEVQFAVAAKPESLDVEFWRAVLGYAPLADDAGLDPLGHGSTFWAQELDPEKPLRHAMHVDVSVAREEGERRLAAALAAGGAIVEETNAPGSWILADRAGNKVCIAAWPDGAETPGWAAPEGDEGSG
jgi:4a-hydroxytetrahydrobiopterin dehydratase